MGALKRSAGTQIVIFEFLLATLFAWVAVNLIPSSWTPPLRYVGVSFPLLFQVVVTIVAFFLFSTIGARPIQTMASNAIGVFPKIRCRGQWIVAWAFLALALIFFLTDLSRNRYGSVVGAENVSDTTLSIVLLFFKCYYSALVLAGVINNQNVLNRKQWVVVYAAMLLCVDGMAHMVLLVIFLIYLFASSALYFNPNVLVRRLILYVVAVVLVFGAYVLGVGWKENDFSRSLNIIQDYNAILNSVYWVAYRLSTVFLSAAVASNVSYSDPFFFVVNWEMIYDEFMYRSCKVVTAGECSEYLHPLKSIARFNFSQLLYDDPGRGGASPGVLGSALYAFPWPVSGIACGFYYALIGAAINSIHGYKRQSMSLLCLVSSIYLLRILFLNTAAFFNPLSGPFLGLLGVGLAFRQYQSESNK